jgi:glycosyltransferase involved in cell wall biosynthesis
VTDEEKWRLLGRAWLLLHSAHHEGWGMVILEAAAAGTPSIGFDVAGVRDAIEVGTTGVLVHSEEELATRWLELAQEPGMRAQLGLRARHRAEVTSWDRTIDHFVLLLEDEVKASRPRRTSR